MRALMIAILVLGSLATIGCGKKKKPSQQAMINACLFDPTGACPRQAAAMAQAQFPGALAYNVKPLLGGQNQVLAQNGTTRAFSTTSGGTIATSSTDVRRQQMTIQSALAADRNNPNSLHYDPPVDTVPRRNPADVDAARRLPTQNEQVGLPARNHGTVAEGAVGAAIQ